MIKKPPFTDTLAGAEIPRMQKMFAQDGAEIPKMQMLKAVLGQSATQKEIQNGAEIPKMQPAQSAPEKGQSVQPVKK